MPRICTIEIDQSRPDSWYVATMRIGTHVAGIGCERTITRAVQDALNTAANWGRYPTRPRIVVTDVFPPIPIRRFDYQAHYEGEEDEHMDVGQGPTPEAAVVDLIVNHPRGGVECERDAR